MVKAIAASIVVVLLVSSVTFADVGDIVHRNDFGIGLTGLVRLDNGGVGHGHVESDLDVMTNQGAFGEGQGTWAMQGLDVEVDQSGGGGGDGAAIRLDQGIGTLGLNARTLLGLGGGNAGQFQSVKSGKGLVSQAQGQSTLGTQTITRNDAGGGAGGTTEIDVEIGQGAGNRYGTGGQCLRLYGDQEASVGGFGDLGKVQTVAWADTVQVQEIN